MSPTNPDEQIRQKAQPVLVLGDDGELPPDKPKRGELGTICRYCGFISSLHADYCHKCNRRLDAVPPNYRWAGIPAYFLLWSLVSLFVENDLATGIVTGVIAILGFVLVIKWMEHRDEEAFY